MFFFFFLLVSAFKIIFFPQLNSHISDVISECSVTVENNKQNLKSKTFSMQMCNVCVTSDRMLLLRSLEKVNQA